jgi:hypothetical protein
MSQPDRPKEKALKGFSPVASEIYLTKQPNLSLFCKPKIMALKSPNLQLLEKLESEANTKQIVIPDVLGNRD